MSQGPRRKEAVQAPPVIDMSDLEAAWPRMSPAERRRAVRARIQGTDRGLFAWLARLLGLKRPPQPPTPKRVAARALVLTALVARARLEQTPEVRSDPLATLKQLGIVGELEPIEHSFLRASPGRADPAVTAAAPSRIEGAAVLAWALNRFPLPPYDQPVDPAAVEASLGFADPEATRPLLNTASLRPVPEINRLATLLTLVTWRLRTFRLYAGPWDFVGHLRKQPAFTEAWLTDLRLLDGDLALGDQPLAQAPAAAVDRCERIVLERHIATYWLQGDNVLYSSVDPSTLLSAC